MNEFVFTAPTSSTAEAAWADNVSGSIASKQNGLMNYNEIWSIFDITLA